MVVSFVLVIGSVSFAKVVLEKSLGTKLSTFDQIVDHFDTEMDFYLTTSEKLEFNRF